MIQKKKVRQNSSMHTEQKLSMHILIILLNLTQVTHSKAFRLLSILGLKALVILFMNRQRFYTITHLPLPGGSSLTSSDEGSNLLKPPRLAFKDRRALTLVSPARLGGFLWHW